MYPREVFLGYIYEGGQDLEHSEEYYLNYLEKNEFNKFATIRLVKLYQRMGVPQKATTLIRNLYLHRDTDWEVAQLYLNHLEDMQEQELLYSAQKKIAFRFLDVPRFPKQKVKGILDDAYQYSIWSQRYDDAYELLLLLVKIADDPKIYKDDIHSLDVGLQKTDKVIVSLKEKLSENENDIGAIDELVSILMIENRLDEGLKILNEGLGHNKGNIILLERKLLLYGQQDNPDGEISVLKKLITNPKVHIENRIPYMKQLAELYLRGKKGRAAVELYEDILRETKELRDSWFDLYYAYKQLGEIDKAVKLLEKYRHHFSGDLLGLRELAEIYLYEEKSLKQTNLYADYVSLSRDREFAHDVSYFLSESGDQSQLKKWIDQCLKIFPNDPVFNEVLLYRFIDDGRYRRALLLVNSLLRGNGSNYKFLLIKAQIFGSMEKKNKAKDILLNKLKPLVSRDIIRTTEIARELIYLGAYEEALTYLKESSSWGREGYFEDAYWTGEAAFALKRFSTSEKMASIVLDKAQGHKLSLEQKLMVLRSKGRLHGVDSVNDEFNQLLSKYEKTTSVWGQWFELLIEKKKYVLLAEDFQRMLQSVRGETSFKETYAIRLALLQKNWTKARELLEQSLKDYPQRISNRIDLAYAYLQDGHWMRALETYELINKRQINSEIIETLSEMRMKYHNRIGFDFFFESLGDADHYISEISYSDFLNERWQLTSHVFAGHFINDSLGINNWAEWGDLSLKYHQKNWLEASVGIGFGHSAAKNSVSGMGEVKVKPKENTSITLRTEWNNFYRDISQAVSHGVVRDKVEIEGQSALFTRLLVGFNYGFERYRAAGGSDAQGQRFGGSIDWVVFTKPYVTIGYEFEGNNFDDDGAFFGLVPLIESSRTHYLRVYGTQRFHPNFKAEFGGFIGGDAGRDLNLIKGDLWGARASFDWALGSWIDVTGSYDYGRESLTGLLGQSHYFHLGLSGHWK